MPSFRTGLVTAVVAERVGMQRVLVDGEPAVVLTQLIGPVAVGDRVVVNTTAVALGLGSGGDHYVHWNLTREAWSAQGRGHLMKLRYTSLQVDTGSAEEELGPPGTRLEGIPVVVCTVHSQVAVVALAFTAAAPGRRLVYVMTDGGALPIALSDLVARLRAGGELAGTVSAGHAFGGDLEALSVPAALALARHRLEADAIVVGMGPGVAGTGSALGTTAVEAAPALDAAAALGGRPILCVRASSADPRTRHAGVSHHTSTVLELVRSPVLVPVPAGLLVDGGGRHQVEVVDDLPAIGGDRGVTTMGRGPSEDPLFFRAAAAAGVLAARLGRGRR
jgi:hypothetical protein